MGLSWGWGYFFTQSIFEKHNIDSKSLKWLFIGLFVASWIGAKVFFLWFSSGPKIYQYIYANYFWLGGGFVFYGGLLLGLAYFFFHSMVLKKFPIENSKYLLPGLVFGHAIGRVGCFLTGCCYGAITDSAMALTIKGEHRFPVQAYEAIALFFIGMAVLNMLKRQVKNSKVVVSYLISYSVVRFFLEYLRGDEVRGFIFWNLSTSQVVSLSILLLSIVYLIFNSLSSNRDN